MSTQALYVMTAKSLQDYILQGDKLRLMIGASELIEELPNTFIGEVLSALHLTEGIEYRVLTRAAGGARLLFSNEDDARNLASILPLVISVYAPGLEVVQDVRKFENGLAVAMEAAERQLQLRRNLLFAAYPVAGPLVERAPRSGRPAVGVIPQGDEPELADAAMLRKNALSSTAQHGLLDKLLSVDLRKDAQVLKMPEDIENLQQNEDSYIAILHADANGLGTLVRGLITELKTMDDNKAEAVYRDFSTAIATATERAMGDALAPLVTKAVREADKDSGKQSRQYLPFRPLVCAGDDVTIILRAPEAIAVAASFLTRFERTSAEAFAGVAADCLKGKSLTAAVGIVFVHKNFPFSQAYELCESLCKYAKNETGRQESSLAFRRLTTTIAEDFSLIVARELTTADTRLTMMPYRVGMQSSAPALKDLLLLAKAVKDMPRGSLRGIISELYSGREHAQRAFERINDVAGAVQDERMKKAFAALKTSLISLTCGSDGGSPLWNVDEHGKISTPLYDAIELLAAIDDMIEETILCVQPSD